MTEKISDHQRDQVLDILEKRLRGTHRGTAQETSTYTPYGCDHTNAAYDGSFLTGEENNLWLSFELIPSFVLILAKSYDKILAKNDTLKFTTTIQITQKETTQHWPCADLEKFTSPPLVRDQFN